tara:strand:+ start:254 stop:1027 length:774 start_codon:yes stop_codon:yes gene_type:complete
MLGFLKTLGGAVEKEEKATKTKKEKVEKTKKAEKTKKTKKEKTKKTKSKPANKETSKPVIKRFRKKIILLGLPASGKGTVGHKISQEYKISHLSSGKILRKEAELDTKRGKEIKELMMDGKLVPNEYLVDTMRDIVKRKCERRNGFILDGYPRNLEQAKVLDEIFKENKCEITDVLLINISYKTAKDRALARKREDDNLMTINNRIRSYDENVKPILEHYKKQGLLRIVDGNNDEDRVYRDALTLMKKAKLKKIDKV